MSKKQSKKKRISARSRVAMAGAVLALPMLSTAPATFAQKPTVPSEVQLKHAPMLKYEGVLDKHAGKVSIVGMDNGQILFKNAAGNRFTVNPATGDMVPVDQSRWLKFGFLKRGAPTANTMLKFSDDWVKMHDSNNLTIAGVDNAGHTILQNTAGQRFYVNPMTGDFVYLP